MKHVFATSCVIALVGAYPVNAQQLSYQINGEIGQWANNLDAHGIQDFDGIAGEDNRNVLNVGGRVAYEFQPGWIGEADLNFHFLESANAAFDTDDATKYTRDITLRLHHTNGNMNYGAFVGYGQHDDYGDSDEDMNYTFLGVETGKDFGSYGIFAQVGGFDSEDEYNEGLQHGAFIRVGGNYEMQNGYRILSSIAYATGNKSSTLDAKVMDLELGVERDISNSPFTLYGVYQHQQNSFDDGGGGGDFGDSFGIITVGLRATFGNKASHGRKLPSVGKWVAYQANEIE